MLKENFVRAALVLALALVLARAAWLVVAMVTCDGHVVRGIMGEPVCVPRQGR